MARSSTAFSRRTSHAEGTQTNFTYTGNRNLRFPLHETLFHNYLRGTTAHSGFWLEPEPFSHWGGYSSQERRKKIRQLLYKKNIIEKPKDSKVKQVPYKKGNNLKKLNCHFVFPQQLDDQPELQKRAREVTHSDIHCGVLPDVEVYEKFEDFMKGEDTIYNKIYEYFNK